MKKVLSFILLSLLVAYPVHAGWSPGGSKEDVNETMVDSTLATFKEKDPDLKRFFDNAYGYAVFPTVGKGGIGLGGAYGTGYVYEKGKLVGRTTLTQVSFGFQLGGQAYSEMIFFRDKTALRDFQSGNFELGAAISAVALVAGASADADYSDGVAVFTMTKGGLMYEAAVAGQKFSYSEINN